jgi:hypothetical protein
VPDIKVGDTITGRCVTTGTEYTGRVTEVIEPGDGYNERRYRLADTGRRVDPVVRGRRG